VPRRGEESVRDEVLSALPTIVIGIGSNLGDRLANLEGSIRAIEALPGVEVVGRSSVWQTRPVGGPPQPDFYNAALAIRCPLPPQQLMCELLEIERRFGRTRSERNAPRTLDLDVLWIEGVILRPQAGSAEGALEVPHPRLHERPFALIPLLEVVRDAADPATGKLYATILAELGTEGVSPLDSSGA
jgi:2-amino-4-hydroxy-6-hydroxymethyldihydropteridine diphosphokinase